MREEPISIERKPELHIIEKPIIIPISIEDKRKPEVERKSPPLPVPVPRKADKPELPASQKKKSEEESSRPEEKTSIRKPEPEETSSRRRKLKKFSGAGGRIHSETQIDEILDFWLMTGELPTYVSDRQRWSYRHHERLPERRELLEQRRIPIVVNIPGTSGHAPDIIPLKRGNGQR